MRILTFLVLAIFLSSCQEPMPITNLEATITGIEEDTKFTVFKSGWQGIKTYLKPGATISINGDAETFMQKGAFADQQQQLVASYFQEKDSIRGEHLSMRSLFGMEPDSFLIALETAKGKFQEHLASTTLPATVTDMEQEGIDFQLKEFKFLYPPYTQKEAATLPADLKDPLAGVDLKDEDKFANNPAYASLVESEFNLSMNMDTTGNYEQIFMDKIAAMPTGNIRNAMLFGNLQYMISPNDKLEDQMAFFRKYSTDPGHLAKMNEQYEAYQSLMKGKPSPTFDYENHKGGKTKLEDLRGKYVYVDVWATWCGPCIGEIPSLKEKEKKYHDANVEFVSISIDDLEDEEKWRGMVDNKELGGVQLLADNAWQSSFPQEYKINGIPRFILIDPAGNIVSADAPRPSDDEFDALFTEEGLKP